MCSPRIARKFHIRAIHKYNLFRWSRDPALRLIAHGKEGPHVFLFLLYFSRFLSVPRLISGLSASVWSRVLMSRRRSSSLSHGRIMRFFSLSWCILNLGVAGGVLEQLVIGHGFLSGLFTPLGCAAYGNRVPFGSFYTTWVCRQRQLRVTVNRGPYGGDFHHHMIIFA